MRVLKLLLAATLVVVTLLYGFTTFQNTVSGRNEGPTISCPQEVLEVSVQDPESVLRSGITAQDKQDGDLTSRILIQGVSRQITDQMTKVTFLVFDSDGNSASVTRTIRYKDYTKPHFVISQPLVYYNASSIALLDRLQAVDCIDGDITNAVRVSSLETTNDPEIYTTNVQVTNSLSDTARLTLPLVIYATTARRPEILLTDSLVYLKQGTAFRPQAYLSNVVLPTVSPAGQTADLSKVQITGSVNTSVPGTYLVHYRYPYEDTAALTVLTVVVE